MGGYEDRFIAFRTRFSELAATIRGTAVILVCFHHDIMTVHFCDNPQVYLGTCQCGDIYSYSLLTYGTESA